MIQLFTDGVRIWYRNWNFLRSSDTFYWRKYGIFTSWENPPPRLLTPTTCNHIIFICHSSDYQKDFCPLFGPMHRFFSKTSAQPDSGLELGNMWVLKCASPKKTHNIISETIQSYNCSRTEARTIQNFRNKCKKTTRKKNTAPSKKKLKKPKQTNKQLRESLRVTDKFWCSHHPDIIEYLFFQFTSTNKPRKLNFLGDKPASQILIFKSG